MIVLRHPWLVDLDKTDTTTRTPTRRASARRNHLPERGKVVADTLNQRPKKRPKS
jgi:hypothetical protein